MSSQPSYIGSELNILLMSAFNSYRKGLLRQSLSLLSMPSRDFETLKFLGTLQWVQVKERLNLRKLHIACRRGLGSARQGRLEEAQGQYDQAEQLLSRMENGSRTAWLLGTSTLQAGVAYLDFKYGHADLACERLGLALDADLELEKLGFSVMQVHRIQQGHNLARMNLRLGRRDAAIGLAGALLAYMECRANELPYHRDWRYRSLLAVPRNLVQAMIHQILGETAGYIVTGEEPMDEWRKLIEASRLSPEPETALFPQVQYALRGQSDLLSGNPKGYLSNVEHFFRFGIRDCYLLWYPVMVEFLGFCRHIDTHYSHQVCDVILRDSVHWRGLPPSLRSCFDLEEQRTVA